MRYPLERMEELANGIARHSEAGEIIRQLLNERKELIRLSYKVLSAYHGYEVDKDSQLHYAARFLSNFLKSVEKG